MPKITYCCAVWAAAVNSKWCVSLLRSAQRPSAIGISRAFGSRLPLTAALLLANLLPLDLKIKETVALKSLSGSKLPLSSAQMCSDLIDRAQAVSTYSRPNHEAPVTSKSLIKHWTLKAWDNEWKHSKTGALTREFYPSVMSARSSSRTKYCPSTSQILTGHSFLNQFLFKIGVAASPICACTLDVETVYHFLFHCPLHQFWREDLKRAAIG